MIRLWITELYSTVQHRSPYNVELNEMTAADPLIIGGGKGVAVGGKGGMTSAVARAYNGSYNEPPVGYRGKAQALKMIKF
jgi:hypothetical protein